MKRSILEKILKIGLLIFTLSSRAVYLNAQSLPLGFPMAEETLRREQLKGNMDSLVSFTVRPVYPTTFHTKNPIDSSGFTHSFFTFLNGKGKIDLLPLQLTNVYNTNHPYGWNNGSLLRSRGLQSLFSGGIYAKIGPLRLQLRPEAIYVQNKPFQGFPFNKYNQGFSQHYYNYQFNRTDMPERFGSSSVYQLLSGQSKISLDFAGLSLGVSTQNIWWGPGKRNALLMSNNARGFPHISFNSTKPLKTPIGHLEWQMIVGKLSNSNIAPPSTSAYYNGSSFFWGKRKDWRYLSGFNISYHPKWIPGLFLGITRTIQQYHQDMLKFKNYYPVIMNFFRSKDKVIDDKFGRDQYASVYLRWMWKKAKAEWYMEYGWNDALLNLRDLVMNLDHSRAYTFGMTKLIPLSSKDQFIQFSTEFTHLQQTLDYKVRNAFDWYTHYQILHGYTNYGEVLGAGIGPGSNVQYFEVSWVKGVNKLGFMFQRLVHNNDFYYNAFNDTQSLNRNWVDLSPGMVANWKFNHFILSGNMQFVRSLNYYWYSQPVPNQPFMNKGWNVSNLHLNASMAYFFH